MTVSQCTHVIQQHQHIMPDMRKQVQTAPACPMVLTFEGRQCNRRANDSCKRLPLRQRPHSQPKNAAAICQW